MWRCEIDIGFSGRKQPEQKVKPMGLKHNKYYWNYSLKNPESATDFYYTFDKIIVTDENFIRKVERLRDLITTYCVLSNRNLKNKLEILDEICGIVFNEKNIQYINRMEE